MAPNSASAMNTARHEIIAASAPPTDGATSGATPSTSTSSEKIRAESRWS